MEDKRYYVVVKRSKFGTHAVKDVILYDAENTTKAAVEKANADMNEQSALVRYDLLETDNSEIEKLICWLKFNRDVDIAEGRTAVRESAERVVSAMKDLRRDMVKLVAEISGAQGKEDGDE